MYFNGYESWGMDMCHWSGMSVYMVNDSLEIADKICYISYSQTKLKNNSLNKFPPKFLSISLTTTMKKICNYFIEIVEI